MTDPLETYDIELLKKYSIALQELETLPSAKIELTAEQALALVTFLQFAAADAGGRNNPLRQSAIAAAKQIQSTFNTESAIFQVLELGWRESEYTPPDFSHTTAIFEHLGIND